VYLKQSTSCLYGAYGHDNTWQTTQSSYGVASYQALTALLFICSCGICCVRPTHPTMARVAYVVAKLLYASAYLFGGVWHQRLAFGQVDTPLERNANVRFDSSLHTPWGSEGLTNGCFGDSELWWSWLFYTLKGCLAAFAGCVAIASTVSLFSISAPRIVNPLVLVLLTAGLATTVFAHTIYNGPLLNAIGGMILPGVAVCYYSVFLAWRSMKCTTACCKRKNAIWDEEAEQLSESELRLEEEEEELSSDGTTRGKRLRTCILMVLGGSILIAAGVFVWADDWDWMISWNCTSPCPDNCPLPFGWTQNAIVNYVLVLGWALCDVAMCRLLPALERQLKHGWRKSQAGARVHGEAEVPQPPPRAIKKKKMKANKKKRIDAADGLMTTVEPHEHTAMDQTEAIVLP